MREPDGTRLCDVDGDAVAVAAGEAITPVERAGGAFAVVHDPALARGYRPVVERVGALAFTLVDYARVFHELALSRRRIAERDGEERGRLERDLHDGVQQRLLAMQMTLAELGRKAEGTDLAAPLRDVSEDAASAVAELRRVAHGIYPPLLLERGVADALLENPAPPSMPVRVADKGIGRLQPAVERALYFAASEGIQNAMKHSAGREVNVTLQRFGNVVEATVEDDGDGFDTRLAPPGAGLMGIRDRIESVGGEVEIESAPGAGTLLRLVVPCSSRMSPAL